MCVFCISANDCQQESTTAASSCSVQAPLIAGLADSALSASSFRNAGSRPAGSRLHSGAFWRPASEAVGEFVQADLGALKRIEAIATQGHPAHARWVTSYKFAHSVDDVTYDYVMNADDGERVFSGNSDSNTVVVNDVSPSIVARYVRLYPQTYQQLISVRWEVYGCSH